MEILKYAWKKHLGKLCKSLGLPTETMLTSLDYTTPFKAHIYQLAASKKPRNIVKQVTEENCSLSFKTLHNPSFQGTQLNITSCHVAVGRRNLLLLK